MKVEWRNRIFYYCLALVILAFGLELNSKTGLGVSPIISISYVLSVLFDVSFPNMTLFLYILFVVTEIVIHRLQKRESTMIIKDILQIPMSLCFTRFMALFEWVVPNYTDLQGTFFGTMPGRLILLGIAVLCTGIGAAMSLNMRIVPNPGDGIVQAIASCIKKDVGLTKNIVDAFCITASIFMSFLFIGHLEGIAIGTVVAMIGTGRCIALFNALTQDTLLPKCGLSKES